MEDTAKRKRLSLLLAFVLLLTCLLTACNQTIEKTPVTDLETAAESQIDTPLEATPKTEDEEMNRNENDTRFPKKAFIVNGVTIDKFLILNKDFMKLRKAQTELTEYLKDMGMSIDKEGYRITLELTSDLSEEEYRITVSEIVEKGMSISGGSLRGLYYGVYGFLEKYAGVRFFTAELETCKEGNIELRAGVYEFSPMLKHRQIDWYAVKMNPEWCLKNGINCSDWYGGFPEELGGSVNYHGLFVHTFSQILGTPTDEQPCLTSQENLENTIAYIREHLAKYPDAAILSVSQNDNWNYCKCANCQAIAEEEGSPAGTLLRFVNALAEEFAEDYPNLTFDTLAYQWTQTAPTVTKPRENVCVRLCSILCDFTHPLNDNLCAENRKFQADIEAWSKICDNLYIWDYTNNYRYSIATYANLHVLRENMQFYIANNVKGMFPQGNCYSVSGELGELRTYLLAKLMWNPMMSQEVYDMHMNEFLQAYYGEGWEYIRQYIDEVCAKAATGCQSIYGHPFEAVTKDFWEAKEETFETYWNKAEELAGDRLEYVQRSRLQWRYIQLMLHPNEDNAKALIEDVTNWGVWWLESQPNLPENIDLTKGPDTWFTFTWWV